MTPAYSEKIRVSCFVLCLFSLPLMRDSPLLNEGLSILTADVESFLVDCEGQYFVLSSVEGFFAGKMVKCVKLNT